MLRISTSAAALLGVAALLSPTFVRGEDAPSRVRIDLSGFAATAPATGPRIRIPGDPGHNWQSVGSADDEESNLVEFQPAPFPDTALSPELFDDLLRRLVPDAEAAGVRFKLSGRALEVWGPAAGVERARKAVAFLEAAYAPRLAVAASLTGAAPGEPAAPIVSGAAALLPRRWSRLWWRRELHRHVAGYSPRGRTGRDRQSAERRRRRRGRRALPALVARREVFAARGVRRRVLAAAVGARRPLGDPQHAGVEPRWASWSSAHLRGAPLRPPSSSRPTRRRSRSRGRVGRARARSRSRSARRPPRRRRRRLASSALRVARLAAAAGALDLAGARERRARPRLALPGAGGRRRRRPGHRDDRRHVSRRRGFAARTRPPARRDRAGRVVTRGAQGRTLRGARGRRRSEGRRARRGVVGREAGADRGRLAARPGRRRRRRASSLPVLARHARDRTHRRQHDGVRSSLGRRRAGRGRDPARGRRVVRRALGVDPRDRRARAAASGSRCSATLSWVRPAASSAELAFRIPIGLDGRTGPGGLDDAGGAPRLDPAGRDGGGAARRRGRLSAGRRQGRRAYVLAAVAMRDEEGAPMTLLLVGTVRR